MDSDYLPETILELENWMKENCFNFDSYAINGNSIYEGHGIHNSGQLFIWYYTERGQKNNLKYFKSEAEIVAYAFNQVKSDHWAQAHCIGFSADQNKIRDLKNELQEMKMKFFEDLIPYYGTGRPVCRVFVSGCDIKKAKHLKEKYCTEK